MHPDVHHPALSAVTSRVPTILLLVFAAIGAACNELPSTPSGSVFLGPAPLDPLEVGDSLIVTATGLAEGGGPYSLGDPTWSSEDPSVASVTALSSGSLFGDQVRARIVALSAGTTMVSVDTRAGSASMEVQVVADGPDP